MKEISNFLMPILSTSRNYGETLSKLAGFALYETYFLTFFLRQISQVNEAFTAFETNFHLDAGLNITGALIAAATALLSRAFVLHNKISNILGIRYRFDINHILLPLAKKVGFRPTPAQMIAIKRNRKELMYELFYEFASSRDENPIAGKHNVEHAMDAWSWFWWPVEATVFVLTAAICAFVFGSYAMSGVFASLAVLLPIAAACMYPNLRHKAKPQVSAIAADLTAKLKIQAKFNAL